MHSYKNNIVIFNILPCAYQTRYSDVLDFARTEDYIDINGIYQWKAAFAIPTLAQRIKANTLIKSITTSLLDTMLFFYLFQDASGQSDGNYRSINYVTPGTFQCTQVNSPTFGNNGVFGNGSSSYLNTHCTPSTHGGSIMTTSSSSLAAFVHDNVQETGVEVGTYNSGINNAHYVQTRSTLNALTVRCHDGGSLSASSIGTSVGYSVADRSASNARAAYKNASSVASDAQAVQGLSNNEFYICGSNNAGTLASPSTKTVKCVHGGAHLTGANITTIYNALNTYFA